MNVMRVKGDYMKQYASIFNDVLGPVMSGPSSSHTAASVRVGKLVSQIRPENLKRFLVEFDKDGSLAPSYRESWVDVGLAAGIQGMLPDDRRLQEALALLKDQGIDMEIRIGSFPGDHPNTYRMTLEGESETVRATALSVGGGMVELIGVNGFDVSITGGFYETLIFTHCSSEMISLVQGGELGSLIPLRHQIDIQYDESRKTGFYVIRTEEALDEETREDLEAMPVVERVFFLEPVLPVTSQLEPTVPFLTAEELLEMTEDEDLEIWQAAVRYESDRGGMSAEETVEKMRRLADIMQESLDSGLAGTEYEKRILGAQSLYLGDPQKRMRLVPDDLTNEIIRSVSALMEVKSSMGIFVAAPTGGSCGCVTGTILAVANHLKLPREQVIKALFAAGIIGVFLAERATFAAELAGCQAECGSGSGMAAAGLVQLMGGTAEEACNAASMALQNVFGLTCDPVAMGVEAPCLGKNVMSGVNALTCANMAMAGFDPVVPLDQTIDAFNEVGRMIPVELRYTGLAGLTCTQASREAEKKL